METMKRKLCLIESSGSRKQKNGEITINSNNILSRNDKMYKSTIWYKSLLCSEKTCLKEDKVKKIHYKFENDKEMVEEYNIDTQVLLRRAWKVKGKIGGEGKWLVEIGDPIHDGVQGFDSAEITECKDEPVITIRNTRVNIEWRIRNLIYPIYIYSFQVDNEQKCLIVSTSNKKYYKKLDVPDVTRLGLPLDQANIQASHKFNTLIISYKKPPQLLAMDKEWYEELKKIKPVKDIPDDCKTQ